MNYPNVDLHIDGVWRSSSSRQTIDVTNPATEETIGTVASADRSDLEEAVASVERGQKIWSSVSPLERSAILRTAADLIRRRSSGIAQLMTMEQGKILSEAEAEMMMAADIVEWFAEEGRRAYGRVIPSRRPGVQQVATKEPVGPVAAFTPWNSPVTQVARKLAAALAAGCSIVVKAPVETPASPAELIRAFVDAGLPTGVINLVFGLSPKISEFLIPHPAIRKISFTGSTSVGKSLAALAGHHMKRTTMELGGHAAAIVYDDADVEAAAKVLVAAKYRNAGQICISPTRFLVQEGVYHRFMKCFVEGAEAIKVGNGLDRSNTMGALINGRRVAAIEEMVLDAKSRGGRLVTGGSRLGNKGHFFKPTVISEVPPSALAMNDEPFGPLAIMLPFLKFEDAITEANRLSFGLASYAFTKSAQMATETAAALDVGMVSVNSYALGLPETPFGGIKDSGYGVEGGTEGLDAYLSTKFVSHSSF